MIIYIKDNYYSGGGKEKGKRTQSSEDVQANVLTIVIMDDLKVFDGSLRDPSVEVEHVGLRIVVPHGSFIVQLD